MIYPTTLSSALRTSPNLSSPLYRRWFPGAGQRGGGFAGVGIIDPETGLDMGPDIVGTVISNDPLIPFDPSVNPSTLTLSEPSLYTQLVAEGVSPLDAAQYDQAGATAAGFDPSVYYAAPGYNQTPAGPAGPSVAARGAAATGASANTAAQLAGALARAIAPNPGTTTCPPGYVYGAPGQSVQLAPGMSTVGTGRCVPISGLPGAPGPQWVSFATNKQIITYGVVVVAALVLVNLIPSGGRRRR